MVSVSNGGSIDVTNSINVGGAGAATLTLNSGGRVSAAAINVANGASVTGNGTVAGPMTISPGGHIAPDNASTINTDDVTFNDDANFTLTIDPVAATAGALAVSNNHTINLGGAVNGDNVVGGVQLQFIVLGGDLVHPVTFTVINAQSGGHVTGNFKNILDSIQYTSSGITYSVEYGAGADHEDVQLTIDAVPEPGIAGLLATAAMFSLCAGAGDLPGLKRHGLDARPRPLSTCLSPQTADIVRPS